MVGAPFERPSTLPVALAVMLLIACESTGGSSSSPGKVANIGTLRGASAISPTGLRAIVRSEPPAVSGGVEPSLIEREVRARLGAIKACYERGLARQPQLAGRVVLHWSITADGCVADLATDSDTLGSAETVSCVGALVRRWRFPAPSTAVATVSFPLVFQTSN